MMGLIPVRDKILVEPEKNETKTSTGIYLPEDDSKIRKGKVLAVGTEDIHVKEGDIVIYESYSGTEIELDGKKYHILKDKDVIAILK
jgi:chaperonin GroES